MPNDILGRMEVWNNRGVRLCELGRYAEAEATYGQALDLASNHADAWGNRTANQRVWGHAEAQASHDDAALTHWRTGVGYAERAVALNPHDREFHRLLNALLDELSEAGG